MATTNTIVDRTRAGAGQEIDYALSTTTTDLSRTINIGSDWKRLRIGMRLSISSSQNQVVGIVINQPQFALGLCNGTSSTYSTSTTHFVGVDLDSQFYLFNRTGTFPNQFGTSQDSSNPGPTRRFVVKTGTTRNVFGAAFNEAFGAYNTSGSPDRTVCYVDISKELSGSLDTVVDPGSWTIRYFKTSNGQTDISASVFYSRLADDTASVVVAAPVQQAVPVSESINGVLNTVNIYWNKNDPPMEISDVAVWRFK